jgi:outer membrane protein assembly factor BamB
VVVLTLLLAGTPAAAAVPAWTTYDHDGARSAIDPYGGSRVSPAPAWNSAARLDGPVYAQPLVVGSRVYVATENDTIYALDAATGAVLWRRSVGKPVPATQPSFLPCGNIHPTVGITSTPVIDVAAGRIYAVANTLTSARVHHQLVALALASGKPVTGYPVRVDPPGADPAALLQRAALALDGSRVIVPYGGNAGDCGDYHGWLVSAAAGNPASQKAFQASPRAGDRGGAIWGSGDGPVLDSAGHLFVSTGNGFGSGTTPDLQESVIELDRNLHVLGHWTADNWRALDIVDLDLGSSEPLPLPRGLLFVAGKDGVGRLLSTTPLGPASQVFSATACRRDGVYGASLYRHGVIYAPCGSGLAALKLSTSPVPSFTALRGWRPPVGDTGPPIFAGGLVWSTAWRTRSFYAMDPGSGAGRFRTTLLGLSHFTTPSAGGGRLFVAAGSKLMALRISSLPRPKLSAVRLNPHRFTAQGGTILSLSLSEGARVRVSITRTLSGRLVGGRCRLNARSGKLCTLLRGAGTHWFSGRMGSNRLALNVKRLAAGSYIAEVLARDSAGTSSMTVTVRFLVVR